MAAETTKGLPGKVGIAFGSDLAKAPVSSSESASTLSSSVFFYAVSFTPVFNAATAST